MMSAVVGFFPKGKGKETQEQFQNSCGKQAIGVRAIEVLL